MRGRRPLMQVAVASGTACGSQQGICQLGQARARTSVAPSSRAPPSTGPICLGPILLGVEHRGASNSGRRQAMGARRSPREPGIAAEASMGAQSVPCELAARTWSQARSTQAHLLDRSRGGVHQFLQCRWLRKRGPERDDVLTPASGQKKWLGTPIGTNATSSTLTIIYTHSHLQEVPEALNTRQAFWKPFPSSTAQAFPHHVLACATPVQKRTRRHC